jgi:hypothetical protein
MESRRADPIRLIALRLNQDEVRNLTQMPGINEVFRVTVQYHDARHPNQVATLMRPCREQHSPDCLRQTW